MRTFQVQDVKNPRENGDTFEATYAILLKTLIQHIKKSLWFGINKRGMFSESQQVYTKGHF